VPTPPQPARILIVDDDAGLRILMEEVLRAEGYQVGSAGSGAAALIRLSEQTPDLMLLDLKMKDIGGPALLERIKQQAQSVPFVVVTGQGDEKIAVEVMKQGALDYVMKDTGLLDLLPGVVKRVLGVLEKTRALAESQTQAHRLEKAMLEIGERERYRIGSDLHDGLGQQLTAIELYCTGLKEDAFSQQPELARGLDKMGKMLRETVAQTRSLARGLVPVGDDPDALRVGLAELADRTNALGRARCRLDCAIPFSFEDQVLAGHLYRIAQEAVNNALKYAQADEITIHLAKTAESIELRISDNGRGLAAGGARGMGMDIMKHRAGVMGGAVTVKSKSGQGVTIICKVPLR
jgi:signal transduction histidine kinase